MIVFSRTTKIKLSYRISRKNERKIIKRSSKSPILVFWRAKTHFAFFEDLLIIYRIKTQLFSPISPNILNKKSRKIIKRSSQIANFIFFYKNPEFGGSFGIFHLFKMKIPTNLQNHPRNSHFVFSISQFFTLRRVILQFYGIF